VAAAGPYCLPIHTIVHHTPHCNNNIHSNPLLPHAVKEFLEKCKSEFEEKWNHPKHVSLILVFSVSVQDFLEKAKKVFEEKWVVNPKVSGFCHQTSRASTFVF